MADDLNTEVQQGDTVFEAAEAIQKLLGMPADEPEETPAEEPEQPQPEAPAAPVEETPDAPAQSDAAPADVTTAPVPPVPAKAPVTSTELETRLAEAAKEKQQAETARNQYLNALNVHIPQLQAAIKGKYSDIQSEDDLIALSDPNSPKYDPSRYNAFQADSLRLQKAARDRESAIQEQQKSESDKLQAWRQEQQTKVAELIPELKDTAKAPALAQKLWAYAQEAGYGREQMERASATDVHLLYQAMLYRDGKTADAAKVEQAAKDIEAAKAKAAKAPPVQKPGVARSESSKDEAAKAAFDRLKKTGHVDDAAEMFRHILN